GQKSDRRLDNCHRGSLGSRRGRPPERSDRFWDAASILQPHGPSPMPISQPLTDCRWQYTLSLPKLDPAPTATRSLSFLTASQYLLGLLLRNPLARSDLCIRFVNILQQFHCLNQPVVFSRI